ncbi:MAG TPA: ATP-binding protein [Vampirovibrionales bacterium]
MIKRTQLDFIKKDLQEKLVFIVGPRQVGKTWIARQLIDNFPKDALYLNFDSLADRKIIEEQSWRRNTELLVLDELHKMDGWKNYLKGLFDTKPKKLNILVTGSARLDTFRQHGDSMAGRFFLHRLMPLSIKELVDTNQEIDIERLLNRGSFPEPYLAESLDDANRWRAQYIDGLIRTDILDFDKLHDFKSMKLLLELLRRRVASPISYSSLAQDIGIAPNTVKKYIEILESLFIVFRVSPYSKNIARSLLKEPKLYFFDNGMVVGEEGQKLENLVAVSLKKHVYGINDYKGQELELSYLKTKDDKEVDFCINSFDGIESAIEVKLSDNNISPSLKYFSETYSLKAIQLVLNIKREYQKGLIEVREVEKFLGELFI